jgi:hypothetical protein
MIFYEKLNQGDVIYTTCVNYAAACYHLGIVYDDGNSKIIYHNDPSNINKFGGSVCGESYEQFMKGRIVQNVIRTNAKNDEILKIAKKCKYERWNTMFFNCEDFVLEIVDGKRRSNLRDAYKLAALGTSTLLLL